MSNKYVGDRGGSCMMRQIGHVEKERASDSRLLAKGDPIRVLVQFGEAYNAWNGEIQMGDENTVGELKAKLQEIHSIPVKMQTIKLFCTKGNILEVDDATLKEAGIKDGNRLLLAGRQSWYPTMAAPEEYARKELMKYEDYSKDMDPVGFWAEGTDAKGDAHL